MADDQRSPLLMLGAAFALLAVWSMPEGCRREAGHQPTPASPLIARASAPPLPERNPEPITHPCTLVVWIGTNLEGELKPCGCVDGMLGGLARRAVVVRGEASAMAVEVGQSLTPRAASNRSSTQLREKGRVILRALERKRIEKGEEQAE